MSEIVDHACAIVGAEGLAGPGDTIAITAGMPFGVAGATNLLRIVRLDGQRCCPKVLTLRVLHITGHRFHAFALYQIMAGTWRPDRGLKYPKIGELYRTREDSMDGQSAGPVVGFLWTSSSRRASKTYCVPGEEVISRLRMLCTAPR